MGSPKNSGDKMLADPRLHPFIGAERKSHRKTPKDLVPPFIKMLPLACG